MCHQNFKYFIALIFISIICEFSYAESLTGKVIVVDPGHAVKNPKGEIINSGCKSILGTKELDMVVDISEMLGEMLLQKGATVYFTRDRNNFWRTGNSQDEDNKTRAEFANSKNAYVFLRIHCNWSQRRTKRGILVLWYKPDSKKIAESISEELKKTGLIIETAKRQHLIGFEYSKVPAVLIEYGYLSNKEDEKLLKTREYIQKISKAVIDGLEKY